MSPAKSKQQQPSDKSKQGVQKVKPTATVKKDVATKPSKKGPAPNPGKRKGSTPDRPLPPTPPNGTHEPQTKQEPRKFRLSDEHFIKTSIVFYRHTYKEAWHHHKDIKGYFQSSVCPIRSVMYPISSDDLSIDNYSFKNAAVVTFTSQRGTKDALTTSNNKAMPFPERKSLPICNVRLEAKGGSKTKQKEKVDRLKQDIEGSNCGIVREVSRNSLIVEVYKFQLGSLKCLKKGTAFDMTEVVDIAVDPDEASDDGTSPDAGAGAGSSASADVGANDSASDSASTVATTESVAPSQDKISPKQNKKKSVLAETNERHAGKAEDVTTDKMGQMPQKEDVPQVPPRKSRTPKLASSAKHTSKSPPSTSATTTAASESASATNPPGTSTKESSELTTTASKIVTSARHATKSTTDTAPSTSASGELDPSESATGIASSSDSLTDTANEDKTATTKLNDSEEQKKKTLARVNEKGSQLEENIPPSKGAPPTESAPPTKDSKDDTKSEKGVETINAWKALSNGIVLTLDPCTVKYISKFHEKDFQKFGVKVRVKNNEVAISKGDNNAQQVKLAKEKISKVIDNIAPPHTLDRWKSEPPNFKDMQKQYDSVAYLEWDSNMKSLVVVTTKDNFERIREGLENWMPNSSKKSPSVPKDDSNPTGDHSSTRDPKGGATKITGHKEDDDEDTDKSDTERPPQLEPLSKDASGANPSSFKSCPLPPIPTTEESESALPDDTVPNGSIGSPDIDHSGGMIHSDAKSSESVKGKATHPSRSDAESSKLEKGKPTPSSSSDAGSSKSVKGKTTPSTPSSDSKSSESVKGKTTSKTPPPRPPPPNPQREKSGSEPTPSAKAKIPATEPAKSAKRAASTAEKGAEESLVKPKRSRELAAPDPMSFQSKSSTLVVHVLVYNITALHVEAIVNAANRHLQHGGGVARAIAKGAGKSLEQECEKYIRQHGPLNVTENMVSGAGKLPCENVIHATGPMMKYYKKAKDCFRDVNRTFRNVIETATDRYFSSLAIPAISSGIYGVPTEIVARAMVQVVSELSTTQTSLQEIYLVDISPDVINLIQQDMARNPQFIPLEFSGLSWETPQTQLSDSPDDQMHGAVLLSDPPADYDPETECCICMCTAENPKLIKQCGHIFCEECIQTAFSHKPVCPVCGVVVGVVYGDQPEDGEMTSKKYKSTHLDGYPTCGTIVINYFFPDGIQKENHPKPGRPYRGTEREAYLPDNEEGRKVLMLLKRAFKQRLVFTVGQSRTTGRGDTVTWNDIHHKTNTTGGAQRFGYPDPTYLSRVQEELAAKGIK